MGTRRHQVGDRVVALTDFDGDRQSVGHWWISVPSAICIKAISSSAAPGHLRR
jgi:hypothetical protein